MAEAVIQDLNLNVSPAEISSQVKTSVEFGTVLVTIVVTDESAERASAIANSIISNYNRVVAEVDVADGESSPITVSTMETPDPADLSDVAEDRPQHHRRAVRRLPAGHRPGCPARPARRHRQDGRRPRGHRPRDTRPDPDPVGQEARPQRRSTQHPDLVQREHPGRRGVPPAPGQPAVRLARPPAPQASW
ncbi:hypothetical protein [Aeromicrobium sp. UC242_57]|uniref:hypothetical protein n=1 Tax=Aeromicrobium sp. UC242_57 TaxID=3374624 RepID=UPI0037ADD5B9